MAKFKAQYIGERLNNEKLCHAFLFEGEEIFFSKVRSCWLGNFYEVKKSGKSVQISTRPEPLGEGPMTEEQRDLWELEATKARQFVRKKRMLNSIKKNPKVLQVSRDLKPLLKDLSFSGKKELLSFIIDELDRENREEEARKFGRAIARASKNAARRMRQGAAK